MLNREQAKAASEAVLEPKRKKLNEKSKKRLKRKEYWEAHRQKGMVGLIGFGLGGVVGYYLAGDVFPWNIFGLAIGFALATLYRCFGIPVNK
ncbi:hypothetical protein [Marinobacter sp. W-8]|uniref:hypothetical protein n=1 Tax=Marinobacter sp. W-8 TaxID=3369658 RepID=UPI0037C9D5EE